MTLTLTIFIKIRVSSSTQVDILWDGTTPIHESSAFQLFIFHIYILSFSFFVIIRNANSH